MAPNHCGFALLILLVSVATRAAAIARLRGGDNRLEDVSALPRRLPLCPKYSALNWQGNASANDTQVVSVYSEVTALNGTGDSQFAAMWTDLGSVGLFRDVRGRSYAYFNTPGSAADVSLAASGAEVDVVRTPAPPAQHGYLSFKGLESVLELDSSDVASTGGAAKPVAFFMKLHLEPAAHHWHGWPRSFGYSLSGYVHLESQGVWRLLAEVQGRVVTNGATNYGGFLGGFGSFAGPLGEPSTQACSTTIASRVGPAWSQLAATGRWTRLDSAPASGAVAPLSKVGQATAVLAVGSAASAELQAEDPSGSGALPAVLKDFPVPSGDNSPASHSADGFRRFGPKRHRLNNFGQYYNKSRVYSCVTPDLAAVMADPGQYQPPPKEVPDFDAQGFCEPLVAEHFWWTPPPVAQKDVEWFYNEITVEESAPYTYFMANGFQGGYFGIQEHPGGKKFALFSVWDAGSKVEIVDWGDGVKVGRFGNEGTGANSNLEFQWRIGEPVQFLVHAKVEPPSKAGGPKTTLYSGYIRLKELGVWRLMSKLRVQPCGANLHTDGHLLGMNSFIEVFEPLPKRPHCHAYSASRRARYGTPWYRRAGASAFEPFANVTLSATCGAGGCPRRGMDFEAVKADGHEAFVLAVGANVTNEGLKLGLGRQMHAAVAPPVVLTETPLPAADNSVAGRWGAFEPRPLRSLGKHEQVKPWGAGPDELACPWYVSDCALPPGLPEEDYIR